MSSEQAQEAFLREIADSNNSLRQGMRGGFVIINPDALHVGGHAFTENENPPLGEGDIKWKISNYELGVDDVRRMLEEMEVGW